MSSAGDSDAEVFVNGVSAGRRHFTLADALSGATLQIAVDAAHLQQNNVVRIVTKGNGPSSYASATATYFSTDKSTPTSKAIWR